jgi:esterase/lipase superfamily enzyme
VDPRPGRAVHPHDCGGAQEISHRRSLGAFHAANFALKRADLFPLAICLSGNYDPRLARLGRARRRAYFNNPIDYVEHLGGDHLDWLRSR